MKRYIILLLVIVIFVLPKNAEAEVEEYKIVSELPEENITLYTKKKGGLFQDFRIHFKGETYFRPFWMNVTNPTYAPELFYEDINQDGKKELIITLTRGYGSGVRDEEVHVYKYTNGLIDVLVDNPLAIIYKKIPDMKLDFGNLDDWGINGLIGLDILMNGKFIIDLKKLELVQNY